MTDFRWLQKGDLDIEWTKGENWVFEDFPEEFAQRSKAIRDSLRPGLGEISIAGPSYSLAGVAYDKMIRFLPAQNTMATGRTVDVVTCHAYPAFRVEGEDTAVSLSKVCAQPSVVISHFLQPSVCGILNKIQLSQVMNPWRTSNMRTLFTRLVALAKAKGLNLRVNEMNLSAKGGIPFVSSTCPFTVLP